MKELFQFLLSNFWIWLGFLIILGTVLGYFNKLVKIILRYLTIRRHGYPPDHCDADGDFRPIINENSIMSNEKSTGNR